MQSNEELVDYLVKQKRIKSDEVEKAFRNVDRGGFVPEEYRNRAYLDRPLPIGQDATISAPHIVAEVTELLEIEENDRVLEVGSGSGYQAAILSNLADEVTGMEIQEELVEKSRKNLKDFENVEIVHTGKLEDVEGLFDKIMFSCAVESLEEAKEKLRPEGAIVGPVQKDGRQVMKRFRDGDEEEFFYVRYVEFQDST